jgi:uncharacterized RDD family membrane protein YckC
VAQYRADLDARMAASAAPPPLPRLMPSEALSRPAGFWIRGAALAIDAAVLLVGYWALVLVAKLVFRDAAQTRAVQVTLDAFLRVGILAYFSVLTWRFGQTLGKAAVRLRVVTVTGEPVSLARALGRALASGVSLIFGIGYVVAALRRDKRALHDLLASTRVERV